MEARLPETPKYILNRGEFDVLQLLCAGYTMKEVARNLCIGYDTTVHRVATIRRKLNVRTTYQAIFVITREGLIK